MTVCKNCERVKKKKRRETFQFTRLWIVMPKVKKRGATRVTVSFSLSKLLLCVDHTLSFWNSYIYYISSLSSLRLSSVTNPNLIFFSTSKKDMVFKVSIVSTSPIDGQKPGTSGLRKKVRSSIQKIFFFSTDLDPICFRFIPTGF